MSKNIKNIVLCALMATIIFLGCLLCIFMPKDTYSQSERRELTPFPTLSVSSLIKGDFMKKFEEYASDAFPFRDEFRSLKAYFSYCILGQKDNNGIYVHNGYIGSVDYPYNKVSIEYAASRFGYIYKNFLQDSKVFLSVIPDKNTFLAEDAGVLNIDASKLVADIREAMPYADYIDIFPTLSLEDYYKTDSHWKQENLTDTAEVLAKGLGVTLNGERKKIESSLPFYGVYYGQAALNIPYDTVSYLTSPIIENMKAYDGQNSKDIPVYDTERLSGRDPYETFLSGPLSLVTIENPASKSERELIIFRDSFGSAIAPLLAEGYSKVTLIDIRYINISYIKDLVDFGGADVLFLYSTSVLNNSKTIK